MDVRLSPEQQALSDSVAQVASHLAPRSVAELDDAERAAKLDAAVASAGWRELRAPAEGGGPWASAVEAAIVAEQLGRGLADVAFLGPTLAAELRRLAGVPASAALETVALRPSLDGLAVSGGTGPRVGGVAIDAGGSTTAVVLIEAADGHRLGEVAVIGPRGGVDLTRRSIAVDAAAVSPVGGEDRSLQTEDLTRWTALGLVLACADLVGTMGGAIALARDYARDRRQFGAAVGSFQAVQHLLADALVAMEGSGSLTRYAAWAVDALPANDALASAATAKAYCARAGRSVCETAVQVHGGIGNTWDCFAHVYLRRALLSTDLLGGVGPNLARVLDHHGIGGGDGLR